MLPKRNINSNETTIFNDVKSNDFIALNITVVNLQIEKEVFNN